MCLEAQVPSSRPVARAAEVPMATKALAPPVLSYEEHFGDLPCNAFWLTFSEASALQAVLTDIVPEYKPIVRSVGGKCFAPLNMAALPTEAQHGSTCVQPSRAALASPHDGKVIGDLTGDMVLPLNASMRAIDMPDVTSESAASSASSPGNRWRVQYISKVSALLNDAEVDKYFGAPVDLEDVSDYVETISPNEPVDLSLILQRLMCSEYADEIACERDIAAIWDNARKYFGASSAQSAVAARAAAQLGVKEARHPRTSRASWVAARAAARAAGKARDGADGSGAAAAAIASGARGARHEVQRGSRSRSRSPKPR
eukprot:TRINITY_DN30170_c0_g1_i1.p1 TRINITY_DN30170_c0_g1~~TRINITY_DN30170_c0_g1_i1.p1  ORF type:complete len:315 (-),score=51.96 TRINITY_DN30170_c0_g1_i1:87-1031(-)